MHRIVHLAGFFVATSTLACTQRDTTDDTGTSGGETGDPSGGETTGGATDGGDLTGTDGGGQTTGPTVTTGGTGHTAAPTEALCDREDWDLVTRFRYEPVSNPDSDVLDSAQVIDSGDGSWTLRSCACGSPCDDGDEWELMISAPAGWEPTIPECVKVVRGGYCGLEGCDGGFIIDELAIFDAAPAEPELVYVVSHSIGTPAGTDEVLNVEAIAIEEEDCGGCSDAKVYDMHYTAGGTTLILPEASEGTLGDFRICNLKSWLDGYCDSGATASWILRRES